MSVRLFAVVTWLLSGAAVAQDLAPRLELSVTPEVAQERATPQVTLNVVNPRFATTCTAAGGWSGTKPYGTTETLPEIVATTTYDITCSAPAIAEGTTVTLTWVPPTTFTDGSPLTPATDLSKYTVHFGPTSAEGVGSTSRNHPFPASSSGTVTGLKGGVANYFCVKAVSTQGMSSACSNTLQKASQPAVPAWSETKSVTVIINKPPAPNPPTDLRAKDPSAYDIRPGSTGALLAQWVGVVKPGTLCSEPHVTVGAKVYHRVPRDALDLVNKSNGRDLYVTEPYAYCEVVQL